MPVTACLAPSTSAPSAPSSTPGPIILLAYLASGLIACGPNPAPATSPGPHAAPDALGSATTASAAATRDDCAPTPTAVDRVTCWTRGRATRAPRPSGTRTMLLTLPPGQALDRGIRRTQHCLQASSFLPGPPEDGRLFYVADGALWAQAPNRASSSAATTEPVPLPGLDPDLAIDLLLAYKRGASPTTLLVAARSHANPDTETRAVASAPWLVRVSDRAITATESAADLPALRDRAAFFAAFHAPRCQRGDNDCLRINAVANPVSTTDQAAASTLYTLDVEPTPGQTGEMMQDLGAVRVVDAAWGVGPDGGSVHLLVGCDADDRHD